MLGDAPRDRVDRYPPLIGAQQIVQEILRPFERDLAADELHLRDDAVQRAFQFANVRNDLVREEFQDLLRQPQRALLRLRLQNAEAQFVGRRMDVRSEERRVGKSVDVEVGGRGVKKRESEMV